MKSPIILEAPFNDELENTIFVESNENFNICNTIDTGAASSGSASTLTSTLKHNSVDNLQKNPGKKKSKKSVSDALKDSKLAEIIAGSLSDTLVFDEVSLDWYMAKKGLWQQATMTSGLKLINNALRNKLPDGFSMSKLKSMEAFLRIYLSLSRWQTSRHLLPMTNGVLDTKTLILEPYTPKNKFRWQLPYAFDKAARIDVIRAWLWDVTGQDIQTVNIIRAFLKITLIGGDVQKFLEVVGPGGTGKSTLIRLVVMLIGEANHAATDLKNLEGNRFEVATLYGKRLAVISDSSRYGGEVSVLKAVTGGDPCRLEKKNLQQGGSFVYDGIVMIASNEPIQSTDYSSGLARRRMPVMFNRKITDADKEKWRPLGGVEKAMQAELPGLLNWVLAMTDDELNAVIGGIDGSLTQSQRVHICETNKLAAWIDDNLIIKDDSKVYCGKSPTAGMSSNEVQYESSNKLYPNYYLWCKENGLQAIALQRFSKNLEDITEHLKLPVKPLLRDSTGKAFQGFAIRKNSHDKFCTPITLQLFNVEGCISNVEAYTPASLGNVDSVEDVEEYLSVEKAAIDNDSEVF